MKHKADNKMDDLLEDAELWESKQLGASAQHARAASKEDDRALDDDLGLAPISLRLQKELVAKLKKMAKQEGLGYQTYIRQVLTRHVRDTSIASGKKESA